MDDTPPTFSTPPAQFNPQQFEEAKSKKVVAGVLGILLGCLGVHKFVLGYTRAGIIMLAVSIVGSVLGCLICLVSVLGCLICLPYVGWAVMAIIGLVEGINYLTKSDEEFCRVYIVNRREWF